MSVETSASGSAAKTLTPQASAPGWRIPWITLVLLAVALVFPLLIWVFPAT